MEEGGESREQTCLSGPQRRPSLHQCLQALPHTALYPNPLNLALKDKIILYRVGAQELIHVSCKVTTGPRSQAFSIQS